LISCSSVGATPTKNQTCMLECDAKASGGSDDCATNPCACTKSGKVCNDAFPSTCGLVANTMHTCDGDRKLSTENDTCTADQFCAIQPNPVSALCKPLCNCMSATTHCSSTFKPACKLPAQSVYRCTADGRVQKIEDCKGTNVCVPSSMKAKCIPPECACKDDTTRCGSTFPATFGVVANTLYQCKKGDPTTLAQDCNPGICSACIQAATAESPDKCNKLCECKTTEMVRFLFVICSSLMLLSQG